LRNPAYAGRALTNRTRPAPASRRRSALLPAGEGESQAPRPEQDWIEVPVPPVVSEEIFAQVQAKLDTNRQGAARNIRHEYLLRALVSCGAWSWRALAASSTLATVTTCAAGAPTRCAQRKGGAAPPATFPPGSLMTWSGLTCTRC
jgi:hypothetical protein